MFVDDFSKVIQQENVHPIYVPSAGVGGGSYMYPKMQKFRESNGPFFYSLKKYLCFILRSI